MLINNSRNLFIFSINFDIDKILMLDKNRGHMLIPLELFHFVVLEKMFWCPLLMLLNNFRNLFIFCINIDIDEVLLLDKNKDLGLIFYSHFPFYTQPPDSGGVLSFHIGCPCVRPSVCRTSARPSLFLFPEDNMS